MEGKIDARGRRADTRKQRPGARGRTKRKKGVAQSPDGEQEGGGWKIDAEEEPVSLGRMREASDGR